MIHYLLGWALTFPNGTQHCIASSLLLPLILIGQLLVHANSRLDLHNARPRRRTEHPRLLRYSRRHDHHHLHRVVGPDRPHGCGVLEGQDIPGKGRGCAQGRDGEAPGTEREGQGDRLSVADGL